MQHFALSDTLRPTWASVPMFSFLLRLKYFSELLQTSGRTPDVRCCAMATAFLYYRTTHTQLSRVFRCFSFRNISPFLLPDFIFIVALPIQLVILAEAPVYKFRLGRPSRLPSVFINFKMDPCLYSSSQNIHSLYLQVQTLAIQLHLDIHVYPSLSNYLPSSIYFPHPADSAPCHSP